MILNLGVDIGSTTVKVVVLDNDDKLLFKSYDRHYSKVREKTLEIIESLDELLAGNQIRIALTGSAGLGVSKTCDFEFVQEVFATAKATRKLIPQTDVVIELGGEDAKIIFFKGGLEERMNGSCAGGTGAFIDQMATLLNVSVEQLNELSSRHQKIYPIASRCGVFAKSDIQPLLNQGARKEDMAASIFQAVVDQTITGLAAGRKIEGHVAFLGGPLSFLPELRKRFVETLELDGEHAIFPENAAHYIAIGAAYYAKEVKPMSYYEIISHLANAVETKTISNALPPLFENEQEYNDFIKRHEKAAVSCPDINEYSGEAYLGIDCGSTTTKLVLISDRSELLYSFYASNNGNPVDIIKNQLIHLYSLISDRIVIKAGAVTGYGEELIKNAFGVDLGLVETVAHYRAARHFRPNVDFILDIGGQDIKCFKIKNNAIDHIMLNEACSSGCGSFLETFAKSLGYSIEEFSRLGIFSKHPVDLGSRCTVFMNSSVKQAQKEGAGVEDISAGLSISVVKNSIYKVIRASSADDLGKNIVVQGGTFLNNAVLRSFEKELDLEVTRPSIAGIMGAYGAALYAKDSGIARTSLITREQLENFEHKSSQIICKSCGNRCTLTVNTFSSNKNKYISGNRCERPITGSKSNQLPNMYQYKYKRLQQIPHTDGSRGRIGIPFQLNMYENLPFWSEFFTLLDFEIVLPEISSRSLYVKGQHTIPSDTVCYPAKLVHGQIESLIDKGVDIIFYPCMPYNFNEKKGDNNYNCPVVAYYPELLPANIERLGQVKYLNPYFGLHRKRDFIKKASEYFNAELGIPKEELVSAAKRAYAAYDKYKADIVNEGRKAIEYAEKNDLTVIALCGRPYHVDPEINHGIDSLISSLGMVIVTEDAISHISKEKPDVKVLNQWTYHSRLYQTAKYVAKQDNIELVQLISFGCGIDAITSDETRDILEKNGKLYTLLKIDEINNLGAVKIRIRSLMAAIKARKEAVKDGKAKV